MAEFTTELDINKINEGRIRIKNTGSINNYGNMFVSPDIFEKIIERVKGTDIDVIILSHTELEKLKSLKLKDFI